MSHDNNFTLLRLLAALAVVLSHSFLIADGADPLQARYAGPSIGQIGLASFFLISGYLLSSSWRHDPSLLRFIARRVLRIFPALVPAALFSAFLAGAVLTDIDLGSYFGSSETWRFVFKAVTLQTIDNPLPGVLVSEGYPLNQVNAPLWTLPVEFFAYLLLALSGVLASLTWLRLLPARAVGLCLVLSSSVACLLLYSMGHSNFGELAIQGAWLLALFFFGVGLELLGSTFRCLLRRGDLALFLGALVILSVGRDWQVMVSCWLLAYLLFSLALSKRKPLQGLLQKSGDLSYGIYIYSFPVQQILFAGLGLGAGLLFLSSSLLTAGLAALSWRIVEKPALARKPRRPEPEE